MKNLTVEIITVGDELLIGQVIDTNSAWMAHELNDIGIKVHQITSVSDSRSHIVEALDLARQRADIILITGGLGPTKDDITKKTLAEYFNTHLIENEDVLEDVKRMIARFGATTVSELNRKQAEVPASCKVLRNPVGTAPAMWFEDKETIFVSMPGVPFEMKEIMQLYILPLLKEKAQQNGGVICHKTIMISGIGESVLSEKLNDWEDNLPSNVKLAYLPAAGTLRLRLSVTDKSEEAANELILREVEKLKPIISEYIFGYDEQSMESVIGEMLLKRNQTVATAESCTGGNVAQTIVSVAGSSAYFMGSVVAYSNNVKTNILKVNSDTINLYGAVSQEVVEKMASGVKELLRTDYAIAISGIAGPDGGTEEKPVGTIWVAVATPTKVVAQKFNLGEHRQRNIQRATVVALNLLRKNIE